MPCSRRYRGRWKPLTIQHTTKVTQTKNMACNSRQFYLAWAAVVLLLGWSARTHSRALPPFLGTYAPDALWALLVFLLLAAWRPSRSTWHTALLASAFAYGIEFSQLYQAPWINAIRATRLGGLVLGHGFLWSDLVCYSVGIGAGSLLPRWHAARHRIGRPRQPIDL